MKPPKSLWLALLGIVVALIYVFQSARKPPMPPPLHPPTQNPYAHSIAATGLVEAYGNNVNLTPYRPGKVEAVLVREGQSVVKGDPIYRLVSADLAAAVESLNAAMASQAATLARLEHQPRDVDLPPLVAAVETARVQRDDAQAQLARYEAIRDPRAISQNDLSQHRFTVAAAQARLDQAQAELARAKAGAWRYDLEKARADLTASRARAREQAVLLAQSTVTAPRNGTILKVSIRPGEFLSVDPKDPPVVMGDTQTLQVRVDVDEINASAVQPKMEAVATLKGNADRRFPLIFDRVVPYMVPKKNLSGASSERVDVRVLQLIYRFKPPAFPVYIGQQVDVYLKRTDPPPPEPASSGKTVHADSE